MPDPETLAELSWPDIREQVQSWVASQRPAECDHSKQALRRRTLSDGRTAYCGQCLECGRATSNISKVEALRRAGGREIKPFDDELATSWRENHHFSYNAVHDTGQEIIAEVRRIKNRRWWSRYNDHLQSDAWRTIRQRVIQRANNQCEGCGVARATQVHHLTYDRVGEEMMFDLVAICDSCHEKVHQSTREPINE